MGDPVLEVGSARTEKPLNSPDIGLSSRLPRLAGLRSFETR
jgi:hypothetical protein